MCPYVSERRDKPWVSADNVSDDCDFAVTGFTAVCGFTANADSGDFESISDGASDIW